ncbi:RNA-directed DNA polymerase, eukaryota [Tanacetum coccineum]|uniref:RNA-directed DNA polymerase, eukaryota n=1 Tax=Tanacetum coccineum TaxID=301880 RepID=A0ABQ4ZH33_9ASTR
MENITVSQRSTRFKSLSEEQSNMLIGLISMHELKDSVWSCGNDKAPGFIPTGCNSSFITLIHKVINPMGVSDYRPISLIAFVKGCQILDGLMLVNEVLAWYKKKKKRAMVLKIDFEKAYDSLSWEFLDRMMEFMHFPIQWRKWIRASLHSARASILINGSPTVEFRLQRGLRQGDPLSHFLFIIAMEGLHVAMEDAIASNFFQGLKIGNDELSISHLLYADDVLFMREWSSTNIHNLLIILHYFYVSSGLKINLHKSNLYGIGVKRNEVQKMAQHIRVCQAKVLEKIRARFFWGGGDEVKKIPWVKWKSVMASYDNEGLNIGSLEAFNIALLLKWRWRFVSNSNMLWVKVIKEIYGVDGGFDQQENRGSGAQPWARIIKLHSSLVAKGIDINGTLSKRVGNGSDTRFWEENWIAGNTLSSLYPRLYALELNPGCTVAERWNNGFWDWKWRRNIRGGIEQCQFTDLMARLSEFSCSDMPDRWWWDIDTQGELVVSSTRYWLYNLTLPSYSQATRWNTLVPRKVNILFWRVALDRIPTRSNLLMRGINIPDIMCAICGNEIEDKYHVFSSCEVAVCTWRTVFRWL